jgi:PmbA protein
MTSTNGDRPGGGELLEIARRIAAAAGAGEQVEAYVTRTHETDVEVFGSEVESLTTAGIEGVGVRVIVDHRQGYASAGSLDPTVVEETLQEARDNAAFGEPDEWYALATPADIDGAVPASLDLWRDELATVRTDEKVRIALDLEAATKARDPRVRGVEGAGYGDASGESAIANSLGVEASTRRTTSSAYSVALADDGSGTQTGYGFAAGRSLAELDLESIPRDAVDRAVRLLGAKPVSGRRIPVLFDPLVTRSVLGVLSSAFNGEMLIKGRSLFAGRDGEQIAAPIVEIVDDPTDPRMFGATTYDSEGVPTRRNDLVRAGVLTGFLHNVYTGKRAGARTTGSAVRGGYGSAPGVGVRALSLLPGTRSPEELMAAVPEAFYVQSVTGLHSGTNAISGDFSVGAVGLMVRNGAFAEPVREVTVASTLQRMLLDVQEIGSDLLFLPGAASGVTVLVSEMTLSGV